MGIGLMNMPSELELPLKPRIPLCVPEIRGNEWKYVKDCLDTGWVSSVGAYVDKFEAETARYVGVQHAVATVNGTAALHISLLVAGVRQDDEVLVSALTFIAPANAVRYIGAWPVFMDAEPLSWQMDTQKVEEFLRKQCRWMDGALRNKTTNRRVKAILPVHILGHPVDLDPLMSLAEEFDLAIIEDATESLGATYKGRRIGQIGHLTCFSYNGNKVLTTGGGGMITTNNESWASKARYLTTQAKDDPLEYVHGEIGFNYRLTNLQAALGCAQMELLDTFVDRKRAIAATYRRALESCQGIQLQETAAWAGNTAWLFTILIREAAFGISSRELMRRLSTRGIDTRPLWQPLHQSPAHRHSQSWNVSAADVLHRDALSLPCSVGLTGSDQQRVISEILICGGYS